MTDAEQFQFRSYAKLGVYGKRKVHAIGLITEALARGHAHVACSWGKDSTVLLHLAQQVDPAIMAIHLRTPQQELLDNYQEVQEQYCANYPTRYHVIDIAAQLTIPMAVQNMALWDQYPVALIGIRAEENRHTRGMTIAKHGLMHQYKRGTCQGSWRVFPLGYWTWLDVWAYIVEYDLPYLASYDHPQQTEKAHSRTTNIMPFGNAIGTSRRYGRIAHMKRIAPAAYQWLQEHAPHIAAYS